METYLTNKVTAANTVVAFCLKKPAQNATNPITAFAPVLATVQNKLTLINGFDQIVVNGTSGVTLDTTNIRITMVSIADKCANAVLAFANFTSNNTLAATVKYSPSALAKMSKKGIITVCQAIQKAASDNITDAVNYGIILTDPTDLQSAIDLFSTDSTDPRQAAINRKKAGQEIERLVKEIYAIQFKGLMDVMFNTLKSKNKALVDTYYSAREIIDLGTTHTKLRGSITDPNLMPLFKALITLTAPGKSEILYQTFTLINGTFDIVLIKPENYDITYSIEGFITQKQLDFHFKPGYETKHKIVLQPVVPIIPV